MPLLRFRIVSFFLQIAALATVLLPGLASAQGYRVTAPLEGQCRPDLPPCAPFTLLGPPAIHGDFVVFTSRNGPPDGIWSYEIATGTKRKLAGFETAVPGGTGTFSVFGAAGSDYPTTVGGAWVVFFGRDQNNVLGIYSVKVTGGTIYRIANTTMLAPGGTLRMQDLRYASVNANTVGFVGVNTDGVTGIYKAHVKGTGLERDIDGYSPLDARSPNGPVPDYFGLFFRAVMSKSYVHFYGSGLFDPVSGPNAIFRNRSGYEDIADNMTWLEGGTRNQHVRISNYVSDVTSSGIAFHADEPGTGYTGLFKVRSMNSALAYVTTNTNVLKSTRKFSTFLGFGLDASGLAFTATYHLGGSDYNQSVYVVPAPGEPHARVADGRDYYLPTVGDRSISDGRIVFFENSNFNDGFLLATPK